MPDRPAAPPEAWSPLWRATTLVKRPIERFLHQQAASGIVLIFAAVIALGWANSRWYESYEALLHLPVQLGVGSLPSPGRSSGSSTMH